MRPVRFVMAAAVAALVFTALPSRAEEGKLVRSFPFSDKETKVGVKNGDALIGPHFFEISKEILIVFATL